VSTHLPQRRPRQEIVLPADQLDLSFNFAAALPGRASSLHSQRAYFRWIDHYLVSMAQLKPTRGEARVVRMMALPIPVLQSVLSAPQLRAWLGVLVRENHGKQGVDQARAAVVTLADLLAEAGWIPDSDAAAISRVRPPRAEEGQRPGRWLSLEQIKLLMIAARQIATSDNQRIRNDVVMTALCTMALRREELSAARWGDLSLQNNRMVLRVHGKGRKAAFIDVPRTVTRALENWRHIVSLDSGTEPHTPLVRRLWKGGRVADFGLSPDGIWLIVDESSRFAGIGHVAPHDLRRSVAGALNEAGTPIDQISRLLRHANVAITERYLNRLAQANRAALEMSSLLGLEDDDEMGDWPGFDVN
jgi:integrase